MHCCATTAIYRFFLLNSCHKLYYLIFSLVVLYSMVRKKVVRYRNCVCFHILSRDNLIKVVDKIRRIVKKKYKNYLQETLARDFCGWVVFCIQTFHQVVVTFLVYSLALITECAETFDIIDSGDFRYKKYLTICVWFTERFIIG